MARTFPRSRWRDVALYAIVTGSVARKNPIDVVRRAAAGGADAIQLREKELSDRDLLELAKASVDAAHEHDALLVVNDRPDVAYMAKADGVHLGQGDLPPDQARNLLGPTAIIGVSAHSLEEAETADAAGADYVAVGAVFPTSTKPEREAVGPGLVADVVERVNAPVVAIGGITLSNVGRAMEVGCRCVCVCSAIISADDVEQATRELKKAITSQKEV